MREDLLDAQAVIDWAYSQIHLFDAEVNTWLDSDPYSFTENPDPKSGLQLIKITVQPPPRFMDVHFGIIVHALRSSLDMLAVALARRNGVKPVAHIHFPVSRSAGHFKSKGAREKIKGIKDSDIAKIEDLQPHKGGNGLLLALHDLDLIRKHTRLLQVRAQAPVQNISGWGQDPEIVFYEEGRDPNDQSYTLLFSRKAKCKLYISPEITVCETCLPPGDSASALLRKFAALTQVIVNRFDT
jgi:hypothetical protein